WERADRAALFSGRGGGCELFVLGGILQGGIGAQQAIDEFPFLILRERAWGKRDQEQQASWERPGHRWKRCRNRAALVKQIRQIAEHAADRQTIQNVSRQERVQERLRRFLAHVIFRFTQQNVELFPGPLDTAFREFDGRFSRGLVHLA